MTADVPLNSPGPRPVPAPPPTFPGRAVGSEAGGVGLPPTDRAAGADERPTARASSAAEIPAALAGLDELERRPTADHVAAFERVHIALTDALAAIDGV